MYENEGFGADDDMQPMRFGTALIVPDREVGTPLNTYRSEGEGFHANIPRQGYLDLLASAALGFTDFQAQAQNILPYWGNLTASGKSDQFDLYRMGTGTLVWLEIECISTQYKNRGPNISLADRQDLINAAAVSKAAFDATMANVAGGWFSPLSSPQKLHYSEAHDS